MRLVTYRMNGAASVGVLVDDDVADIGSIASDMLTLIKGGARMLEQVETSLQTAPRYSLESVELLPPLQPVRNIFCVGLNYLDHALEGAGTPRQLADVPTVPVWFTKATTGICGPSDDVSLDTTLSDKYDWEAELAIVIGQGGKRIAPGSAFDHIHSYTLINDVTARDVQRRGGGQWFVGKSVDRISPLGPHLVTADEVDDVTTVELRCLVNGVVKQSAAAGSMLFDIPALIADISRFVTLQPGDVIATGTPAGIGAGRVPQEFLRAGDELVTESPQIGLMRNRIVEVREPAPAIEA